MAYRSELMLMARGIRMLNGEDDYPVRIGQAAAWDDSEQRDEAPS